MSRDNKYTLKNNRGFTLLEVLIALLVLSIGLLGLAALQTTGLRSNQMASMRTQATQIAYDITDRMRANPVGTTDGNYVVDNGTHPTITTDCTSANCSTSQLATFDLAQWKDAIVLLPGGLGEIAQTAADPLTHTITIRWDEARTGIDGTDPNNRQCPPQDEGDLRCFRLVLSE